MAHDDKASGRSADRRSLPRIKTRLPVVIVQPDRRPLPATTRDISRDGLLLELAADHGVQLLPGDGSDPVGTTLSLMLVSPLVSPDRALQLRSYRVVHWSQILGGRCLLGLARTGAGQSTGSIDPSDYVSGEGLESEFLKIIEQINFQLASRTSRVIMLCGAEPGAGVTTLSWWLAGSLARLHSRRVLFADANLRPGTRPEAGNTEGLTEVLLGQLTHAEAVIDLGEGVPAILNAGGVAGHLGREINDAQVRDAFDAMRSDFDYTIIDALPPSASPLTLMLARRCDGVFLVLASGATDRKIATEAIDELRATGAPILGVLLNRA